MKEIINSGENLRENEDVKILYNKTHGISDPGQQKERNYNWPVDKTNYVFGKPIEKEQDGAKKSLQTDVLQANYPKTVIAKKSFEDFRQANGELLGKSKFKGALNQNIPEDFSYGKKTIVGENWNVGKNTIYYVAKCINGDSNLKKNEEKNFPDKDLALEERYGKRRVQTAKPTNHDPNRMFGTPSIRKDIPSVNFKSITNPNVI